MWNTRVANLGTISYAFEVHRRGSRDSAILNLQKVLRQEPLMQKVVLASTEEEIVRFKSEVSALSADFRTAVGYFAVDTVEAALGHVESRKDILNVVGLMRIERVLR